MNINITAEDYFNELKLMQKQYGQEEDLYPWIYMLLQMAECKKREMLGNEYKPVSIRDVHKHGFYTSADSLELEKWKFRWDLSRGVGHPEFAIVSGDKIIGCIEVKKNDMKQRLMGVELNEPQHYILNQQSLKYHLKFSTRCKDKEFQKSFNKEYPEFSIKNGEVEFEIENEKKVTEILKKYKYLKPIPDWKFKKQIPTKEYNQLMGHVFKFKNVLFTNGLEFYFLKLNGNQIEVSKLADLTSCFEKEEVLKEVSQEEFNSSFEQKTKKFTINEDDDEWTKLIKELANRNWYE